MKTLPSGTKVIYPIHLPKGNITDSCLLLDYMMGLLGNYERKGLSGNMKRNMEITKGLLVFSKGNACPDRQGLTRHQAYDIVHQRYEKLQGKSKVYYPAKKGFKKQAGFFTERKSTIFDYNYYIKHVDDVFKRLG